MNDFYLLVNGECISAESHFPVIDPSNEEILAECPNASIQCIDLAVKAAYTAFPQWRLDIGARKRLLRQCAIAIKQQRDNLANILTREQGKPLNKAYSEIDGTAEEFELAASFDLATTVLQNDAETSVNVYQRPIGVVAIITPWNFPVYIASAAAAALLAGNTVVLKPSPHTPLATLKLGEIFQKIFPPGVINIIAGDDNVGKQLTQHPLVRKIAFTGSVATGMAIAHVAAEDLKRVTLELGGNDAAIVLDDVDLDKIAEKIFWGAFANTGQICVATKRLYVDEKIHDALVSKLVNIAENIRLGSGLDSDTQLGPLNNQQQLDIVSTLVEDARRCGAKILCGGKRLDRKGYFYQPTLVTNIKEGTRLVDEEQFGPVLPIMTFKTVEEAITRTNNSKLGLGAVVWSGDWEKGAKIAAQLEVGTAWVNRIFSTHPLAPFGGFKHSGIGRAGGPWGLSAFTELQTICVCKSVEA